MNQRDQKLIDAIIQKAEKVCPDSLALIGVYGSVATGDTHEKSDLDLLILINDDQGWQLAECFILEDIQVGYDLYCTNWAMLEGDARCDHAHLSKLLDCALVYVKDQSAVSRLEMLQQQARALLASDARFEKAQTVLDNAKKAYAHVFLTDTIAEIREYAGEAIYYLLDAMMLYHGRYFRRGVKRTFEELRLLPLPFDAQAMMLAVIRGETPDQIRSRLTELMRAAQTALPFPVQKEAPSKENLSGTYEEMFSNWRNKMQEAAGNGDLYSSFMNMLSLRAMLKEIAQEIAVEDCDIMGHFNPQDTAKNAAAFDAALANYLQEYKNAGISPRCFADLDDFLKSYLGTVPE